VILKCLKHKIENSKERLAINLEMKIFDVFVASLSVVITNHMKHNTGKENLSAAKANRNCRSCNNNQDPKFHKTGEADNRHGREIDAHGRHHGLYSQPERHRKLNLKLVTFIIFIFDIY
jgi:hypothetical protein